MSNGLVHKLEAISDLCASKSAFRHMKACSSDIDTLEACLISLVLSIIKDSRDLTLTESFLSLKCSSIINKKFKDTKQLPLFEECSSLEYKRTTLLYNQGLMFNVSRVGCYLNDENHVSNDSNKLHLIFHNHRFELTVYQFNEADVHTYGLWNITCHDDKYICLFRDGFRVLDSCELYKLLLIAKNTKHITDTQLKDGIHRLITKDQQLKFLNDFVHINFIDDYNESALDKLKIIYGDKPALDLIDHINIGFNTSAAISHLINSNEEIGYTENYDINY